MSPKIPDLSPKALEAERARLAAFFTSIAKHRRALELAIEDGFGGDLDAAQWRASFDSTDPHDALRTMAVTACHSAILNSYVEILRASAGARLLALSPHRRPHAAQVFELVQVDGGFTANQSSLLSEIYMLEGRLEHASPDVDAGEVREAVERLREALPSLVESARDWLRSHGIEFSPAA